MIRHAADGERRHVILARDAAEIRPEPFADGGRESRTPFFGGENTMHQAGVEGVHGRFKIITRAFEINVQIISPKIAQPFMAGNHAIPITKSR